MRAFLFLTLARLELSGPNALNFVIVLSSGQIVLSTIKGCGIPAIHPDHESIREGSFDPIRTSL
jgi:hypothetical protein